MISASTTSVNAKAHSCHEKNDHITRNCPRNYRQSPESFWLRVTTTFAFLAEAFIEVDRYEVKTNALFTGKLTIIVDGGNGTLIVRPKATLASVGDMMLRARKLMNDEGSILSKGVFTHKGEKLFNREGKIVSEQKLILGSRDVANSKGVIASENDLVEWIDGEHTTDTRKFDNRYGVVWGKAGVFFNPNASSGGKSTSSYLMNDWGKIIGTLVTMRLGRVSNQHGKVKILGPGELIVSKCFDNTSGLIDCSNKLTMTSEEGSLNNTGGLIRGRDGIKGTFHKIISKDGRFSSHSGPVKLFTYADLFLEDSIEAGSGITLNSLNGSTWCRRGRLYTPSHAIQIVSKHGSVDVTKTHFIASKVTILAYSQLVMPKALLQLIYDSEITSHHGWIDANQVNITSSKGAASITSPEGAIYLGGSNLSARTNVKLEGRVVQIDRAEIIAGKQVVARGDSVRSSQSSYVIQDGDLSIEGRQIESKEDFFNAPQGQILTQSSDWVSQNKVSISAEKILIISKKLSITKGSQHAASVEHRAENSLECHDSFFRARIGFLQTTTGQAHLVGNDAETPEQTLKVNALWLNRHKHQGRELVIHSQVAEILNLTITEGERLSVNANSGNLSLEHCHLQVGLTTLSNSGVFNLSDSSVEGDLRAISRDSQEIRSNSFSQGSTQFESREGNIRVLDCFWKNAEELQTTSLSGLITHAGLSGTVGFVFSKSKDLSLESNHFDVAKNVQLFSQQIRISESAYKAKTGITVLGEKKTTVFKSKFDSGSVVEIQSSTENGALSIQSVQIVAQNNINCIAGELDIFQSQFNSHEGSIIGISATDLNLKNSEIGVVGRRGKVDIFSEKLLKHDTKVTAEKVTITAKSAALYRGCTIAEAVIWQGGDFQGAFNRIDAYSMTIVSASATIPCTKTTDKMYVMNIHATTIINLKESELHGDVLLRSSRGIDLSNTSLYGSLDASSDYSVNGIDARIVGSRLKISSGQEIRAYHLSAALDDNALIHSKKGYFSGIELQAEKASVITAHDYLDLSGSKITVTEEFQSEAALISEPNAHIASGRIIEKSNTKINAEKAVYFGNTLTQDAPEGLNLRKSIAKIIGVVERLGLNIFHADGHSVAGEHIYRASFLENRNGILMGDATYKADFLDNRNGQLIVGDYLSTLKVRKMLMDSNSVMAGAGALSVDHEEFYDGHGRIKMRTFGLNAKNFVLLNHPTKASKFFVHSDARIENRQKILLKNNGEFIGSHIRNTGEGAIISQGDVLTSQNDYCYLENITVMGTYRIQSINSALIDEAVNTPGAVSFESIAGSVKNTAPITSQKGVAMSGTSITLAAPVDSSGRGRFTTPGQFTIDHTMLYLRDGISAVFQVMKSLGGDIRIKSPNGSDLTGDLWMNESDVTSSPQARRRAGVFGLFEPTTSTYDCRVATVEHDGNITLNIKTSINTGKIKINGDVKNIGNTIQNKNITHVRNYTVQVGTVSRRFLGFNTGSDAVYEQRSQLIIDVLAEMHIGKELQLQLLGLLSNDGLFTAQKIIGEVGSLLNGIMSNIGRYNGVELGLTVFRDMLLRVNGLFHNRAMVTVGDRLGLSVNRFLNETRVVQEMVQCYRIGQWGRNSSTWHAEDRPDATATIRARVGELEIDEHGENLGAHMKFKDFFVMFAGSFSNRELTLRKIHHIDVGSPPPWRGEMEAYSFKHAFKCALIAGNRIQMTIQKLFLNSASHVWGLGKVQIRAGEILQQDRINSYVAERRASIYGNVLNYGFTMERASMTSQHEDLELISTIKGIRLGGSIFGGRDIIMISNKAIKFIASHLTEENSIDGMSFTPTSVTWQNTEYTVSAVSLPKCVAGRDLHMSAISRILEIALQLHVGRDRFRRAGTSIITQGYHVPQYRNVEGFGLGISFFGSGLLNSLMENDPISPMNELNSPPSVKVEMDPMFNEADDANSTNGFRGLGNEPSRTANTTSPGEMIAREIPLYNDVKNLSHLEDGADFAVKGVQSIVNVQQTVAQLSEAFNQGGFAGLGGTIGENMGITDAQGNFSPKITMRFGGFTESSNWTMVYPSRAFIGRDSYDQCQYLEFKGTHIYIGQDWTFITQKLVLESEVQEWTCSSLSAGISVEIGPRGCGFGMDFAFSEGEGKSFQPTQIFVGRRVNGDAAESVLIRGGNINAFNLELKTRHLEIETLLNTADHNSFSVSFSINELGGSGGFGLSSQSSAQPALIAGLTARAPEGEGGTVSADSVNSFGGAIINIETIADKVTGRAVETYNQGFTLNVSGTSHLFKESKSGLTNYGSFEYKSHKQNGVVHPTITHGTNYGMNNNSSSIHVTGDKKKRHFGATVVGINGEKLQHEFRQIQNAFSGHSRAASSIESVEAIDGDAETNAQTALEMIRNANLPSEYLTGDTGKIARSHVLKTLKREGAKQVIPEKKLEKSVPNRSKKSSQRTPFNSLALEAPSGSAIPNNIVESGKTVMKGVETIYHKVKTPFMVETVDIFRKATAAYKSNVGPSWVDIPNIYGITPRQAHINSIIVSRAARVALKVIKFPVELIVESVKNDLIKLGQAFPTVVNAVRFIFEQNPILKKPWHTLVSHIQKSFQEYVQQQARYNKINFGIPQELTYHMMHDLAHVGSAIVARKAADLILRKFTYSPRASQSLGIEHRSMKMAEIIEPRLLPKNHLKLPSPSNISVSRIKHIPNKGPKPLLMTSRFKELKLISSAPRPSTALQPPKKIATGNIPALESRMKKITPQSLKVIPPRVTLPRISPEFSRPIAVTNSNAVPSAVKEIKPNYTSENFFILETLSPINSVELKGGGDLCYCSAMDRNNAMVSYIYFLGGYAHKSMGSAFFHMMSILKNEARQRGATSLLIQAEILNVKLLGLALKSKRFTCLGETVSLGTYQKNKSGVYSDIPPMTPIFRDEHYYLEKTPRNIVGDIQLQLQQAEESDSVILDDSSAPSSQVDPEAVISDVPNRNVLHRRVKTKQQLRYRKVTEQRDESFVDYLELPKYDDVYFHATSLRKALNILKSRSLKRLDEEGAFVATTPELEFGKIVFVFNRSIEPLSKVLNAEFMVGKNYWIGFAKSIPIRSSTLEYVAVYENLLSITSIETLEKTFSELAGMEIIVKPLKPVRRLAERRTKNDGNFVPAEWPTTLDKPISKVSRLLFSFSKVLDKGQETIQKISSCARGSGAPKPKSEESGVPSSSSEIDIRIPAEFNISYFHDNPIIVESLSEARTIVFPECVKLRYLKAMRSDGSMTVFLYSIDDTLKISLSSVFQFLEEIRSLAGAKSLFIQVEMSNQRVLRLIQKSSKSFDYVGESTSLKGLLERKMGLSVEDTIKTFVFKDKSCSSDLYRT